MIDYTQVTLDKEPAEEFSRRIFDYYADQLEQIYTNKLQAFDTEQ
jgi:hypothetical protein